MDTFTVLFWFFALSSGAGLFKALSKRSATTTGWIVVSLTTLVGLWVGLKLRRIEFIYGAGAFWVLFAVVPGSLANLCQKRMIEQRYGAAYRLARVVSWLHPFGGWREQPEIVRALGMAQGGEIEGALEILRRFEDRTSPAAVNAMVHFYRMTNRWEDFLGWVEQLPKEIREESYFTMLLLRARGEIGDVAGMVELYGGAKEELKKMGSSLQGDYCRLYLFAFTGRRDLVEEIFSQDLRMIPQSTKDFWVATAELAGGGEGARERFERQVGVADAMTRVAIERRLARPVANAASLSAEHLKIIEEAAREQSHEKVFNAQPPLLTRGAFGVQLLIGLNLVMFGLEVFGGGSTNMAALLQLGAMYGPLVNAGDWWRPFTALFLHFGPLHLAMNMFALWALGPFVEWALRFPRFMGLYIYCGVGSMIAVMKFSNPMTPALIVGASGAILGLFGGTAALMLKGWIRLRAYPAKRRLVSVIGVVGLQTFIDSLIPQVSMTAHLSGFVIGFLITMFLPSQIELEFSDEGR